MVGWWNELNIDWNDGKLSIRIWRIYLLILDNIITISVSKWRNEREKLIKKKKLLQNIVNWLMKEEDKIQLVTMGTLTYGSVQTGNEHVI